MIYIQPKQVFQNDNQHEQSNYEQEQMIFSKRRKEGNDFKRLIIKTVRKHQPYNMFDVCQFQNIGKRGDKCKKYHPLELFLLPGIKNLVKLGYGSKRCIIFKVHCK